jgi:glycosyltransferase involved in cell wall biosynthesis
MEAMACGAALCTYDNGGCRDYAIDGRTAVVAPRRNVDALARGLGQLVEDGAFRERIARDGQAFVTTQFDWGERRRDSRRCCWPGGSLFSAVDYSTNDV